MSPPSPRFSLIRIVGCLIFATAGKITHVSCEKRSLCMAYYALIYDLVEDYLTRRAAFREEHLRLAAEAHARGELVMGGAFADPADKALLVFRGADRRVAESFARNDPYVRNGLIKRWEVRPWTVVIGNTQASPPSR